MFSRLARAAVLLALFGAFAVASPGEGQKPPDGPTKAEAKKLGGAAARLFAPGNFSGLDNPKTTLQEALDTIGRDFGVTVEVNEEAFKQDGAAPPADVPVAEKPLRKMSGATLDRVLTRVLARVPVPTAYLLRGDVVEVTTLRALRAEIWGNYAGPYLPLVHAAFNERPLAEALRELADQSGLSVVLDVRAADKARTPVTARLANTPVDTAVRLLADMAELRPFLVDNTIYVTSRENADTWEKREKIRLGDGDSASGPRVGMGPRLAVSQAAGQ